MDNVINYACLNYASGIIKTKESGNKIRSIFFQMKKSGDFFGKKYLCSTKNFYPIKVQKCIVQMKFIINNVSLVPNIKKYPTAMQIRLHVQRTLD